MSNSYHVSDVAADDLDRFADREAARSPFPVSAKSRHATAARYRRRKGAARLAQGAHRRRSRQGLAAR